MGSFSSKKAHKDVSPKGKVTSKNAMSMITADGDDSKYMMNLYIQNRGKDNVVMGFEVPDMAAIQGKSCLPENIGKSVGAQSMKYLDRMGATSMSFQKTGFMKGEVVEPADVAFSSSNKHMFQVRLTGREIKAAFAYINAKRSHSYTPNYNSTTFAVHTMQAAGISIPGSLLNHNDITKRLEQAAEKEEERRGGKKGHWTLYSQGAHGMSETYWQGNKIARTARANNNSGQTVAVSSHLKRVKYNDDAMKSLNAFMADPKNEALKERFISDLYYGNARSVDQSVRWSEIQAQVNGLVASGGLTQAEAAEVKKLGLGRASRMKKADFPLINRYFD